MMSRVKTASEIEAMRVGGAMLAEVLRQTSGAVQSGMTTKDVSVYAANVLKSVGAQPAFLGYNGFPEPICISVNDEVVHGIPKKSHVLCDGDVVSLDLGVIHKGMIVDSARTVICGTSNSEKDRLLKYTNESLQEGLAVIRDGVKTGDIGHAIETVLKRAKLGIVRDLVGHGVGHEIHEDPNIPNYGNRGRGVVLRKGMTIAVEPMATLGKDGVYTDVDGWTVRTRDESLAAHFEHTVLITDDGQEVLTR